MLLDTAGRLHIDEELMDELQDIRDKVKPQEIWLVVDAQVGQDAVRSAREFDRRLGVTGLILTKTDGDARAGAALSLRDTTGKPIRFVGTGEKLDAIEPFVPERVASRILGMGDIVSLVEKAQESVDHDAAKETAERMFRDAWTLEDFRSMLGQFRALSGKAGGLKGVLGMMPGMNQIPEEALGQVDEGKFARFEAAIDSMTVKERMDPTVLHAQRRARVARGSGTSLAVVNELIKAFKMMKKQVREMKAKGFLGRMAGRALDKQKSKQMRELEKRGVDLRDWFPET